MSSDPPGRRQQQCAYDSQHQGLKVPMAAITLPEQHRGGNHADASERQAGPLALQRYLSAEKNGAAQGQYGESRRGCSTLKLHPGPPVWLTELLHLSEEDCT